MYSSALLQFVTNNKDAYEDHLFVYQQLLKRRKLQKTPCLFTAIAVGNVKIMAVRAKQQHFIDHVALFDDKPITNDETQDIQFVIRLNPCIKKKVLNKQGRYVDWINPIKGQSAIFEWFKERLSSFSIELINIELLKTDVIPCSKGNIVLNEAVILATAKAKDLHQLNLFYQNGIGKRKTYGFGMPMFNPSTSFDFVMKALSNRPL